MELQINILVWVTSTGKMEMESLLGDVKKQASDGFWRALRGSLWIWDHFVKQSTDLEERNLRHIKGE